VSVAVQGDPKLVTSFFQLSRAGGLLRFIERYDDNCADDFDQRRRLMQAWSDYFASPQGAGKAVSMKSRTEANQQKCIRLRLGIAATFKPTRMSSWSPCTSCRC
jgi:hypothetical protein